MSRARSKRMSKGIAWGIKIKFKRTTLRKALISTNIVPTNKLGRMNMKRMRNRIRFRINLNKIKMTMVLMRSNQNSNKSLNINNQGVRNSWTLRKRNITVREIFSNRISVFMIVIKNHLQAPKKKHLIIVKA